MPKDRYSDQELLLLAKAADALESVMDRCAYRDLLYGKWTLLKEDIRQEQAARERERAEMFVSPHRQLINLARWNARRGWGFTDDDLSDIEREIPPEPAPAAKGKPQLRARVLEIHLPDGADGTPGARRTWNELTAILVEERVMRPFHLFEMWPGVKLALSDGGRHAPGLSWRVIDFGHGWSETQPTDCRNMCGTSPRNLGPRKGLPAAGLLAAMAHFPLWLKCMDGKIVPRVWLAGYELQGVPSGVYVGGRSVHHPRLETRSFSDEPALLYYGWEYVPYADTAVPIYADAKTDP